MYDASHLSRPISPEQCRAMRERLNWTVSKLAKASRVPLWYVEAFENDEEIPLILATHCISMALNMRLVARCFQNDLRVALEINTKSRMVLEMRNPRDPERRFQTIVST
jgi:hypothetical protein